MNFNPLFKPDTVAIVGASSKPSKVGYAIISNIINDGFEGKIYPVNPNEKEILGKQCYASVTDIPERVDLVIIVVKGIWSCR